MLFPYPYPPHLVGPPQLPRVILDDLDLTPEQGYMLGSLFDAPNRTAGPARLAAFRRAVGGGMVRLGRLIQGQVTVPSSTARDPLVTAP